MRAVSDTSPLSYLVVIGQTELVTELFDVVTIPGEVRAELASQRAPAAIQQWIERPPSWLEVDAGPLPVDAALDRLHAGERAAILLAERLGSDVVLLDEKAGRTAALGRGLNVSGLLGLLREAADRGLVDLPAAIPGASQRRLSSFARAPEDGARAPMSCPVLSP